jgi:hypothetical protein
MPIIFDDPVMTIARSAPGEYEVTILGAAERWSAETDTLVGDVEVVTTAAFVAHREMCDDESCERCDAFWSEVEGHKVEAFDWKPPTALPAQREGGQGEAAS